MLQDFLTKNREILIDRCRSKVAARRAPRADEQELAFGIPLFLDQLIGALRLEQSSGPAEAGPNASDRASAAARHGSELLRRGFTVGQVVHDYGDLCQAITDVAVEQNAAVHPGASERCRPRRRSRCRASVPRALHT